MDMPTVYGAPRHCYIAGEVYWVTPMTRRDKATVLQWLDDVLPGRPDRKMPPKMGEEASQKALQSFPGWCMIASLALAPHGFSYSQAAAIVPHSPDDDDNEQKWTEFFRIQDVFLSRRRTMKPITEGVDWSETWLEEDEARLAAEYGLKEIGDLTLDQYDWLCSGGKVDSGEQYDLETIVTDHRANALPLIKAAIEAGTLEAYKEEPTPAVIKVAMENGIVQELPPSTQ